MKVREDNLGDWLVTATAACALAACLAGILRPPGALPDPSPPAAESKPKTTWLRLSVAPAASAGAATAAAAAPTPTTVPASPSPLADSGLATLPELPSLPTAHAPGKTPVAVSRGSRTPSAASGAAPETSGPVRLGREELGGSQPWPDYPAAALRRGESGTVTVRLSVEPSGTVRDVRVAGSSGWRSLDEAATDTIRRRWAFPPGEPRDYLVDIRFQIL